MCVGSTWQAVAAPLRCRCTPTCSLGLPRSCEVHQHAQQKVAELWSARDLLLRPPLPTHPFLPAPPSPCCCSWADLQCSGCICEDPAQRQHWHRWCPHCKCGSHPHQVMRSASVRAAHPGGSQARLAGVCLLGSPAGSQPPQLSSNACLSPAALYPSLLPCISSSIAPPAAALLLRWRCPAAPFGIR